MKNLDKVVVAVKEVRYKRIEISENHGFEIPKTAADVADLAVSINNDPRSFIDDDKGSWDSEITVESVDWFEEKEQ